MRNNMDLSIDLPHSQRSVNVHKRKHGLSIKHDPRTPGIRGKLLCRIVLAACLLALGLPLQAQIEGGPPAKYFRLEHLTALRWGFGADEPKEPVTFVVGKSDPARDWYGTQPAASAAEGKSAEAAAAPRTIQFPIEGEPATAYRLHLAFVLGDRAVPAIAVTINGRRGVFYLSSKLNSVIGSMDDQFESAYVPADVSIQFPGNYLHSGTNSIALEVLRVDEPSNLPAGLNYDAIELDSSQTAPASASASIQPTVFYKRNGDKLTELVDVFVEDGGPVEHGELDLELNGAHYKQPLHAGSGFGEQRFEFDVPEFAAGTQAHLSVDRGREDEPSGCRQSTRRRSGRCCWSLTFIWTLGIRTIRQRWPRSRTAPWMRPWILRSRSRTSVTARTDRGCWTSLCRHAQRPIAIALSQRCGSSRSLFPLSMRIC